MQTPTDLGATVGGVTLPFCAMNAAGAAVAMHDVRALAGSRTGAIVLQTTTVHPFVHPQFRSLHNPGFDKLVPLVRELAGERGRAVVASVAGASADEFVHLAHAFGESGAAAVELGLHEDWVDAVMSPFETRSVLQDVATRAVAASAVPVWVRLPDHAVAYGPVLATLAEAGVRAVVVRNGFERFERLLLEADTAVDVIVLGDIDSGYDVSRALARGAVAVQVGPTLGLEGPAVFARLERELRVARGARG